MESQCASGEKEQTRPGWRWIAGREESWCPGGLGGSPVAADPFECLMRKAGEVKSAEKTEGKEIIDVSFI